MYPKLQYLSLLHFSFMLRIRLVSKSVSLFLFCKYIHLYHFVLEFTYKPFHMIFVFLWFSLLSMIIYMLMQVHPYYFIHFNGWVILHCMYVPHLLYPCISPCTFGLLPCLGYCKQCCSEHHDAWIHWNHGFLCTCRNTNAGSYGGSIFSFLRNLQTVLQSDCCWVAKSCLTLCHPTDCSTPRLLCLPLSPRVCSNSCPLSQSCDLTISSSATPSSPAFRPSQPQGVGFSHWLTKVLEL